MHTLLDWRDGAYHPREYPSILAYLEDQHVLGVERKGDGTFLVEERCDHYFSVDLTADQLRSLAGELVALADGAKIAS